jgi:SAM-dependent methyltransferase
MASPVEGVQGKPKGVVARGRIMGMRQALVSQFTGPHGPVGWVTAWIMPSLSDAYCGDLVDALDLQPDDDLLEVACGAGVFLKRHASQVRHVAAIDHSEIQVRMARRRLRDRVFAGTAEIVEGDAAALPWHDRTFSAVACNCPSCFKDPEQSFREMRRVLKPFGRLALSIDHCPDTAAARRSEERWGLPAWTDEEFCALLHEVGFRDIAVSHARGMTFARAVRR